MSEFNKKAKDWDKNLRRQKVAKTVADEIKKIIKDKKIDSILDFGCGTGLLAYNLRDIAKKIIGIDLSEKMVEEFNIKSNSDNIKAYKIDIKNLEKKFDLIVSSMTFHHIKDIENIVLEIKKRLNKNGILCIADLEKEDGSFHDSGNEGVYHFGFDIETLTKTIENLGFEKIASKRVYTIKKHKDFPIFLLCFRSKI